MSDKDVEVLKRDVQTILHYLHNDNGTGEKGLVAKVNQLQIDFSAFKRSYEDNQLIKKTAIGIYGGLGAAIMLVAKWLGGLIINHLHF